MRGFDVRPGRIIENRPFVLFILPMLQPDEYRKEVFSDFLILLQKLQPIFSF